MEKVEISKELLHKIIDYLKIDKLGKINTEYDWREQTYLLIEIDNELKK